MPVSGVEVRELRQRRIERRATSVLPWLRTKKLCEFKRKKSRDGVENAQHQ